jgi:hypothetical protein
MGYIKEKDGVIYQVERRRLTSKEKLLLKKHIALEKSNKTKSLTSKINRKTRVKANS